MGSVTGTVVRVDRRTFTEEEGHPPQFQFHLEGGVVLVSEADTPFAHSWDPVFITGRRVAFRLNERGHVASLMVLASHTERLSTAHAGGHR
jgi:hypothetical protein